MLRSTVLLVSILVLILISTSIASRICGPVCAMYCPYGNVLDSNGCPLCKCKPNPCRNGQVPLKDVVCISGSVFQRCPRAYQCVADRTSLRGFCCPRKY